MLVLRGLLAGAAGTMVVHLLSSGDASRPVYSPERLAGRLASRYLDRRLSKSRRHRYGLILRWLYGPSWGVTFGALQETADVPYPITGLILGISLWWFELVALPISRATPGLERWTPAEILADGVQAILFGVATSSTLALLGKG